MKIIHPSVEILGHLNGQEMLRNIEEWGRVCYKSEDKITEDSAAKFVANALKRGHESIIEHEKITVRIICDRGVTHEIVRHRLASFSQASTRYCNYSLGKYGGEISVIEPLFFEKGSIRYQVWKDACEATEKAYLALLADGASPQEARDVLPNSLATEIVMTANVREWRHFFKLRTSEASHPQMVEVARMLLRLFRSNVPVLFDDVGKA